MSQALICFASLWAIFQLGILQAKWINEKEASTDSNKNFLNGIPDNGMPNSTIENNSNAAIENAVAIDMKLNHTGDPNNSITLRQANGKRYHTNGDSGVIKPKRSRERNSEHSRDVRSVISGRSGMWRNSGGGRIKFARGGRGSVGGGNGGSGGSGGSGSREKGRNRGTGREGERGRGGGRVDVIRGGGGKGVNSRIAASPGAGWHGANKGRHGIKNHGRNSEGNRGRQGGKNHGRNRGRQDKKKAKVKEGKDKKETKPKKKEEARRERKKVESLKKKSKGGTKGSRKKGTLPKWDPPRKKFKNATKTSFITFEEIRDEIPSVAELIKINKGYRLVGVIPRIIVTTTAATTTKTMTEKPQNQSLPANVETQWIQSNQTHASEQDHTGNHKQIFTELNQTSKIDDVIEKTGIHETENQNYTLEGGSNEKLENKSITSMNQTSKIDDVIGASIQETENQNYTLKGCSKKKLENKSTTSMNQTPKIDDVIGAGIQETDKQNHTIEEDSNENHENINTIQLNQKTSS